MRWAAAVMVAKLATGEIEKRDEEPQSAAAEVGRKDGKARAERLTADERSTAERSGR